MAFRFGPAAALCRAFCLVVSGNAVGQFSVADDHWSTETIPSGLTFNVAAPSYALAGGPGPAAGLYSRWLFSSFTRSSTTYTRTLADVETAGSDAVVYSDAAAFYAWSSRTGQYAVLPIAGPFTVSAFASSYRGAAMVVVMAGTAYGYSSFTGDWSPQPLAAPVVSSSTGDYVAHVYDGQFSYGFSAYDGVWSAIGVAGMSNPLWQVHEQWILGFGGNQAVGYSPHQRTWTTYATASQGNPRSGTSGAGFFDDGASLVMFSGLTGNFTPIPVPGTASISTFSMNAAIVQGTTVWCCSGLLDLVVPVASAAAPTVAVNGEWTSISAAGTLRAFSALTGAVSPPLTGGYTVSGGASGFVAVGVAPASVPVGYSALTGGWTPAPAGSYAGPAYSRRNVVVLRSVGAPGGLPAGYAAFSMRSGAWSHLPTPGVMTVQPGGNSAVFVVTDFTSATAFDPIRERFVATALASPTLNAYPDRGTIVLRTAAAFHGFSVATGAWESVPYTGPASFAVCNESTFFAATPAAAHVFSGAGTFVVGAQYPESSRFAVRGAPMFWAQYGAPGGVVDCVLSAAPAFVPLAPYGNLLIDPAAVVFVFPFGVIDPAGQVSSVVTLPADPALSGVQFHLQNAVSEPGGGPYLSNAVSPILF